MRSGTKLSGGAVAGVLTLAGLFFTGSGRSAGRVADSAPIEGTWRVTVTQQVCGTGAPAGPPFQSLLTFAGGGALSGTTANTAFMPGQRSGDFGVWTHKKGHDYTAVDEAFIIFGAGPFTQGSQILNHSISLTDDGNRFDDVASVQFYDVNGNPLLPAPGCAIAVGQRLQQAEAK
jgi:hypothetical protein